MVHSVYLKRCGSFSPRQRHQSCMRHFCFLVLCNVHEQPIKLSHLHMSSTKKNYKCNSVDKVNLFNQCSCYILPISLLYTTTTSTYRMYLVEKKNSLSCLFLSSFLDANKIYFQVSVYSREFRHVSNYMTSTFSLQKLFSKRFSKSIRILVCTFHALAIQSNRLFYN
jgi:hypothetical protein